jgi:hypothetical protein
MTVCVAQVTKENFGKVSPEQGLWRGVIVSTAVTAVSRRQYPVKGKSIKAHIVNLNNYRDFVTEKMAAIDYLQQETRLKREGLKQVLEFAGFSRPEYVMEKLKEGMLVLKGLNKNKPIDLNYEKKLCEEAIHWYSTEMDKAIEERFNEQFK